VIVLDLLSNRFPKVSTGNTTPSMVIVPATMACLREDLHLRGDARAGVQRKRAGSDASEPARWLATIFLAKRT
jgi:hypothetical protein